MNRKESDQAVKVVCHGIEAKSYSCSVAHADEPGEYCFPPMASLITGAARLMLALLEHSVDALGGTYAMEDTDSMAIVATETGGVVPCHGGKHRTVDDREGIRALTFEQVDQLSAKFSLLNLYAKDAIPDSVLKIEDDNYDLVTKKQRQLYCVAISAKRYVLFLFDENGMPVLLQKKINNKNNRWSKHGLGHLLNPIDPKSDDPNWIAQVWLGIVRRSLGLGSEPSKFEGLPAVGRISISSPSLMRCLKKFNGDKSYCDQAKPFNFMLACHVSPFGHPIGTEPERFHLIMPYNKNPKEWLSREWI